MAVEHLFYNLPVRRKELEKNIKREYGKVVSHLHAYACISVGVRFAVSNQMPKSKKVSVFSTKSNTTTKENITNVFGAKTLLTLVKLDLRLEMEPSKGPSTQSARNWSTQATDRSREVRIQGHISKPVFGEGRQVPDRQMFFVNSRPCGLPQVTKAFNEIYKSFNISQSPFIFANLIMDTNAYDVNVSPDKRTIMLHDQTALLESLKTALTELFEQTDHTVPQSQLPSRKLPSYKPLTVPRRASTADDALLPAEDDSNDESEMGGENSDTANTARRQVTPAVHGTQPSLIQSWVGRDTELRTDSPDHKPRDASLSKDKQKLVKSMEKKSAVQDDSIESVTELSNGTVPKKSAESPTNDTAVNLEHRIVNADEPTMAAPTGPDPMGTPYDDLFSQRPAHLPRSVQDFNALMDRKHTRDVVTVEDGDLPVPERKEDIPMEVQPEIASVATSSQKATPGPVQNAFDRMRPKRTPLQTAEITIGDKTTTTVIGSSPPYKRRRVHQPANSQAIAQFGGSPLLARGLRNFAAPGSQLEIDSSEVPPNHDRPALLSDDESEAPSADGGKGAHQTVVEREDNVNGRMHGIPGTGPTSSDPLEALVPAPADDDEYDEDYVDEHEKKIQEDEKVARLVQEAEFAAAQPSEDNLRRASQALKNGGTRKESTLQLTKFLNTSTETIRAQLAKLRPGSGSLISNAPKFGEGTIVKDEIEDANAEARLSLTVSKTDFERMAIIGQFNLGFIIAVRPPMEEQDEDELFIIDQHAADEKYNYERLQRTVTLQNQRLVRPKPLDLTAIEEEIILNNADALKANGFEIETTSYATDNESSGRRCRLITLPISGEKTFELSDLEELLHLLSETPAGSSEIPRPRKVQKMLAMRACRSSIMVGKTLTLKQMQRVVRHMGEMEKPWNCPHGRPTMRHLAGLNAWTGWQEGDVIDQEENSAGIAMSGKNTDWKTWLEGRE